MASPTNSTSSTESAPSLANLVNPKKRTKDGSFKHPVYTGVRKRIWGKWVSEIRQPRKKTRIWLGTFANPEMAALAHDSAALSIKKDSVVLNFPHLAKLLPRSASLLPLDVQAAAVQAATMGHLLSPDSTALNITSDDEVNNTTSSVLSPLGTEHSNPIHDDVAERISCEELGKIIELPSLYEDSHESSCSELTLGHLVYGWKVSDLDFLEYYFDRMAEDDHTIRNIFEYLAWDY